MLPLLASVSIRHRQGPRFRIWLPLFLLWILLLPLVLVLSPIIAIGCLAARLNPLDAFLAVWRILEALKGTGVEVDSSSEAVTVHIV
jgi:hypothetical protein